MAENTLSFGDNLKILRDKEVIYHKDIKTLIQVLELIARVLEWVVNKSGLDANDY